MSIPTKNRLGDQFRVCRDCDVHHVENCTTCFGFGMWSTGAPVIADEIQKAKYASDKKPCPECGATWRGYLEPNK